jgi:hypothetical protein
MPEANLELQEFEEILFRTIKDNLRHKDYDRVTHLAKKYKQLITGEGIEEQLKQFVRREDPDLFEQRKRITKQITPAVMNSIMKPAYKISRCDNIKKDIIHPEEKSKQEIIEKAEKFWGISSVDDYLAVRFIQLDFTDPNAFIVVEFDPFDPLKEKAAPRPFEVSSEMAINFKYKNNILQWLIVKDECTYVDKEGKLCAGEKYTMYLPNDIIVYEEVDKETNEILFSDERLIIKVGERKFSVQYLQPKGGSVQAFRVGHELDLVTDGRTFVSPAEPAMSWLEKSLKHVSEMDLSVALHVFPQKAAVVHPCPDINCNKGVHRITGGVCSTCNGSGTMTHKAAHDVIEVPMPRTGEEFPDLTKYVAYFTPDIALIKWMDDYVDKLEEKSIKAVYNSETFKRDEVHKTATGENIDLQNVYDTLFPIASHFSFLWKGIYKFIAVFTDNNHKDLQIIHKFPRDFKFKSETELIQDLKTVNDSDAPDFLRQEISWDIAMIRYRDDPEALKRYEVRNYFKPFMGKSFEEIQLIFSLGLARQYDKVLWSNFDIIFDDLERENQGFYDLKYKDQVKLVDKKVQKLMLELEAVKAINLKDAMNGVEGLEGSETPTDVEAEAAARLKGSVGGAQVITAFVEKVSQGLMNRDAALESLKFLFKIDDEQASLLLGPLKENPQLDGEEQE